MSYAGCCCCRSCCCCKSIFHDCWWFFVGCHNVLLSCVCAVSRVLCLVCCVSCVVYHVVCFCVLYLCCVSCAVCRVLFVCLHSCVVLSVCSLHVKPRTHFGAAQTTPYPVSSGVSVRLGKPLASGTYSVSSVRWFALWDVRILHSYFLSRRSVFLLRRRRRRLRLRLRLLVVLSFWVVRFAARLELSLSRCAGVPFH